MEILIYFFIIFLLFLSILGSFLPILPGPFLSFLALLTYHFFVDQISLLSIILIGIFIILVSLVDYLLQIYGVKKYGGSKKAVRSSIFGMIIGLFLFPPLGILVGAFLGAFLGAKLENNPKPVHVAFGAFWGFLIGSVLKLLVSFYIIYFLFF